MSGTIEGGLKAKAKNLARNPNHYSNIGRKGGSALNPTKGFGSNRALASAAGVIGGTKSRRRPRTPVSDRSPLSSADKRTLGHQD